MGQTQKNLDDVSINLPPAVKYNFSSKRHERYNATRSCLWVVIAVIMAVALADMVAISFFRLAMSLLSLVQAMVLLQKTVLGALKGEVMRACILTSFVLSS